MVIYWGINYHENDDVNIYTKNADGSFSRIPNYTGKILKFLPENRALVHRCDGEELPIHLGRLTPKI